MYSWIDTAGTQYGLNHYEPVMQIYRLIISIIVKKN